MAASTFGSSGCSFVSSALSSDFVQVTSVHGVERIGELYEFHVEIAYTKGPLTEAEISAALLAGCSLSLGDGADPINGIAREILIRESAPDRAGSYEIIMVPTVWLLTISKLSRLYQKMSVKDMAVAILDRYGLGGHYDLRISSSDPRDFCIQYEESDWDFLQRWFEHEGFFYWFEHTADGEKLCVSDINANATRITGNASLPYRDTGGLKRTEDSVWDWRAVQRRIPAQVILKDYNEEKPLLPMTGQADVDLTNGFGVFFEYGDNFDTPTAGAALAKKRAERFLTGQLTLYGATDSSRFHVGHTFELVEHFDDAQNRKYLITAIEHRVAPVFEDDAAQVTRYVATFEAIPLSVQFRPERNTPWPSVHGLMHGHIESDTSGKFSTLDMQGRYKVRFPFDSTGNTGDESSTWVRMAQHYAGSGYGSHFPLHKGTEVLLAFYDGDPDRPIIVGTVPNPLTSTPSTGTNATQSIVSTHSGIKMTLDDQHNGKL